MAEKKTVDGMRCGFDPIIDRLTKTINSTRSSIKYNLSYLMYKIIVLDDTQVKLKQKLYDEIPIR